MNPDILILNGSARQGGNTDSLLEKFRDGIAAVKLSSHTIVLREDEISDCRGCGDCRAEAACSLDDDMQTVHRLIPEAKVLLFASPLYFCEVTGLLKTVLDRMYFYYQESHKSILQNKRALVICPLGVDNPVYESEICREFFRRFFRAVGINDYRLRFFSDLMEKDAAINNPEALDKAYQLGLTLEHHFK